ncbi:MAG TPA: glycoside hydrolase family 5 protein [Candidatus Faeciplasma pullistercoris]|uniref:Glycoside hydrolase family 5 protein n=1 Tax=Candidatus Faeciplasma pullistercoris TaxID=2840800 RepID=A0A9D1GTZ0_9FIRM|nr:glycoside hydrolase family 5 protein [Candidatus Faeciplasma pullistercoris]
MKLSEICSLLLSLTLSTAMICSCSGSPSTANETGDSQDDDTSDNEQVADMSAMEIAKDMGIGINLGNTFDAYYGDETRIYSGAQIIGDNSPTNYETCWGSPETTKDIIDGFKEAGFNTVRVPVYWGNMMEEDGSYTINPDYISRVSEVVDWILEDEMYCVINIHHYDGVLITNHPQDEVVSAIETLWTQIAEYFKDYPDKLIFEGFNEQLGSTQKDSDTVYTEDMLYEYVNEMNQTFVDAVRNTGGNNSDRMLIISGYNTNIDKTTYFKFKLPEDSADDKLMVSVHYVDNMMYWTNQLGTEAWYNYSVSQCELLKNAFSDKGIPVFIGECTSVKSYNDPGRIPDGAEYSDPLEIFKTELEIITDYGFVPVIWDTANDWYNRSELRFNNAEDGEAVLEIAEKISK